ncbi:MAG: rhodanese-like domain-containing protein, partial [Arenicellales bacterium]|nr:rhodanese-like domain-containing protein [Arenicellales bacterium]
MNPQVTAKLLKQWLSESQELALLDVREIGQHSTGHPFFAVPVPYSRFEYRVEKLVPNKTTKLVILDGDDGVAERAASSAEALGYTNVFTVEGGTLAWMRAG